MSTADEGAGPIRKKGYYRALKRQEKWALILKSRHDLEEQLKRRWAKMFMNNLTSESPFVAHIKRTDQK